MTVCQIRENVINIPNIPECVKILNPVMEKVKKEAMVAAVDVLGRLVRQMYGYIIGL